MKTLLLTLLIIAVGCAKNDVTPTQTLPDATVYTSIEGQWKFTSPDVSGSFTIITRNDTLFVDKVGSFTIKSVVYNITNQTYITGKHPNPLQISMQSPTKTGNHLALVFFNPAKCSPDFKTMTCDYWQYDAGNGNPAVDVNSTIKITR